jgi:uncharacterized protein DUF3857/transglutaminase superfamily protein
MRLRNVILIFLLFCGISPALRAQFQQPTDEELKMTADSKAPGADAVYLYREEANDDYNNFHSYYERIKILTEKGKDLATNRFEYLHGYDTVTDVQGRTIHSDGTVIPLTAKPADLMDVKAKYFQVNSVVITLPDVQVGSILEYRLKIRSPDHSYSQPTWNIQQKYYVHKAHYSYHPFLAPGEYIPGPNGGAANELLYSVRLGNDAKVEYNSAKHLYSLDVSDVPALPQEDWMPPMNTLQWRVEFYYTYSSTGGKFWEDAGKQWAKYTLEFMNPHGDLKRAAADMVSASDTDEQKARKIYDVVQKLDNTDFSRKKSDAERKKQHLREIHNADDVWKDKSGTDDEITLLYLTLARAVGLKAWPAKVVDRDRAIFDGQYLSASQLDDYVAIVELNGKDVYLDPGQRMCPFGSLHWKHTVVTGFRLTDKGTVAVLTPGVTYKTSTLHRVALLTIDPTGQLSGTVRFVMDGPEALRWRQLTLQNDEDEVKKQFNEFIQDQFPDGVQADFDHFLALDDYNANLIAVIKVSGSLGTATGKHVFLPGLFFESRAKHPFVAQDKRLTPIDVHYPLAETDDVTYTLAPGFTVESLPQAPSAAWPDHAVLKIAAKTQGSDVIVGRLLVYNYTILAPKDYPSLHDFYQKVATADQQQVVLTRTPVAKGN